MMNKLTLEQLNQLIGREKARENPDRAFISKLAFEIAHREVNSDRSTAKLALEGEKLNRNIGDAMRRNRETGELVNNMIGINEQKRQREGKK